MTIQASIQKLNEARAELLNHCMAFRVVENDPRGILVIFPNGFAIDGCLIRHRSSRDDMFREATKQCEKYWKMNQL